ncbi:Nucleoporin NDC1, partial [Ophiophagus hannah]
MVAGSTSGNRYRSLPFCTMGEGSTREQLSILRWRAATSIAWSVLLLPLCVAVFISITSIDLFHPIQWITNSFNDLYTSYVIFCILLLSVVILVINVFNVQFHAVVPSIHCSRLALISKIIHPQQVIHSIAHAVMGMLVAWCAAVMTKGKFLFLSMPCTATTTESASDATLHTCLNEYHLFLLLLGAFMGYSYSLRYLVNNLNYLPFPAIQVSYIPRTWIMTTMNFRADSNLPLLDTVAGLLDLSLLYHSWLCGLFLLMTWYIAWLLFRIFSTEAHHFPVQSTFAEEADQCLPKILNSNPPPLLKFLALQDLMFLSQYSSVRRQEVFSLSQPGGHPYNWTSICGECLNLLSDLTQKLIIQQEIAAANGRLKQPSAGDLTQSFSSPDLQLTGYPDEPHPVMVVAKDAKEAAEPGSFYMWLQNKKEQIKSFLSKRVLIMYFFNKHPEASIQALFSDTQMHIWALEGLSHLVASSFTEDRYGVVQTTLPGILTTLLTLQEVIDKHFKLPHVSSKPPKTSGNLADTSYKTLRFALRSSLKTAIYRITTTFGEHLKFANILARDLEKLSN